MSQTTDEGPHVAFGLTCSIISFICFSLQVVQVYFDHKSIRRASKIERSTHKFGVIINLLSFIISIFFIPADSVIITSITIFAYSLGVDMYLYLMGYISLILLKANYTLKREDFPKWIRNLMILLVILGFIIETSTVIYSVYSDIWFPVGISKLYLCSITIASFGIFLYYSSKVRNRLKQETKESIDNESHATKNKSLYMQFSGIFTLYLTGAVLLIWFTVTNINPGKHAFSIHTGLRHTRHYFMLGAFTLTNMIMLILFWSSKKKRKIIGKKQAIHQEIPQQEDRNQ